MGTDPAKAGWKPDTGIEASRGRRSWWRRWRTWLPFLVKPLRRGIVLFIVALVIEYLVVPELVGASKDLSLLGRVNVGWLIAGVVTEALSLFCYGLLTRAVLPPPGPDDPPRPGLSRLFPIGTGERRLADRRRGPRGSFAVLLRPADQGRAAAARAGRSASAGPVPAVPHRPGRRRHRARHPGRDARQRGDWLPPVHRGGHQGQRRRGDDGDQGPGIHGGAERAAVAVPRGLHPDGGLPPDLRDRGHRRRGDLARRRRPGLRHHP